MRTSYHWISQGELAVPGRCRRQTRHTKHDHWQFDLCHAEGSCAAEKHGHQHEISQAKRAFIARLPGSRLSVCFCCQPQPDLRWLALQHLGNVLVPCRSQEESKLSMHIKDSMREQCISEVAEAWTRLTRTYKSSRPELAAFVLATTAKYIHWIDISLVANDK